MAYYRYSEDRALIKGAFCRTFTMRPDEFESLTKVEYNELFPSLDPETTFIAVIRNRMETDKDTIKDFTQDQYAEWFKWQKKKKKFDEKEKRRNHELNERVKKQNEEKLEIARQRLEKLIKQ